MSTLKKMVLTAGIGLAVVMAVQATEAQAGCYHYGYARYYRAPVVRVYRRVIHRPVYAAPVAPIPAPAFYAPFGAGTVYTR